MTTIYRSWAIYTATRLGPPPPLLYHSYRNSRIFFIGLLKENKEVDEKRSLAFAKGGLYSTGESEGYEKLWCGNARTRETSTREFFFQ